MATIAASGVKLAKSIGRSVSASMLMVPVYWQLRLALISLALELAVIAIFAHENVMLYADGGWFVFALATGNPWVLKWQAIAARFTTYALTVWPVLQASWLFHLDPMQIALANGLLFYGIQLVLISWAYWLAWRTDPRLLIFPLTQTLLVSLLGWGFPSELLIGTGFLWIILFTALKNQGPTIPFLIGFAALLFSHELAFPSAVVAGGFALYLQRRKSGTDVRFLAALAFMLACTVLLFWVRAHGGGTGSDDAAIYVLDPRRVLTNPLLVLIVAGALLLSFHKAVGWPTLISLSVLGFVLVMAADLASPLNFDAPRYGVRTLIALGMLTLAILFVFAALPERDCAVPPERIESKGAQSGMVMWLFLCLGLQAGGIAIFLRDWRLELQGEATTPAPTPEQARLVPIEQARQSWPSAQRDASIRLQIEWATPYRQFVMTNGRMPEKVLYDAHNWYKPFECPYHALMFEPRSAYSAAAFTAWTDFTCSQPEPEHPATLKERLSEKLNHFLGRDRKAGGSR
jgi:hypothetical protein